MTPPAQRRTLAAQATVTGLGLFTGLESRCTFAPAPPGTGLVFIHNTIAVPATAAHLAPSPFANIGARHTCLAKGAARVLTCEHALSALTGLGITDATITLEGSGELPIADGSAKPFTEALLAAGLHDLTETLEPITITKPITLTAGQATLTAEPSEIASYTYHYHPPQHTPLAPQSATWIGTQSDYTANIAPARTFSFQSEASHAQSLGLFTAFTPRDLLVLDDTTGLPINNTLHFDNEPARHKLLDLIGDLALAARPIHAKVTATRAGHTLNHQLAQALFRPWESAQNEPLA